MIKKILMVLLSALLIFGCIGVYAAPDLSLYEEGSDIFLGGDFEEKISGGYTTPVAAIGAQIPKSYWNSTSSNTGFVAASDKTVADVYAGTYSLKVTTGTENGYGYLNFMHNYGNSATSDDSRKKEFVSEYFDKSSIYKLSFMAKTEASGISVQLSQNTLGVCYNKNASDVNANSTGTTAFVDPETGAMPASISISGNTWTKYEQYIKVNPSDSISLITPNNAQSLALGIADSSSTSSTVYFDNISLVKYTQIEGIATPTEMVKDTTLETATSTTLFIRTGNSTDATGSFTSSSYYNSTNTTMIVPGDLTSYGGAHGGTKGFHAVPQSDNLTKLTARTNNGLFAGSGNFAAGATYYLSFWAKVYSTEELTVTPTVSACIGFSSSGWSSGDTSYGAASGTLTTNWQQYSGLITIPSTATSGRGTNTFDPVYIGFKNAKDLNILLDDISLVKLPDFELVSSSIDDCKTEVPKDTTTVKLIMNLAVDEDTIDNISINNDASVSAELGSNPYTINLTLSNLKEGTNYTVDLSGVTDSYGREASSFVFSTRPDVMVSEITYDPSALGEGEIKASATVSNDSATAIDAAIIVVAYDVVGGPISDIDVYTATAAANGGSASLEATVTSAGTGTVVTYVWNWANIAPLAEATFIPAN